MIWLMQSKEKPAPERPELFEKVVESFHQLRKRFAQPGVEPDLADTRAVIHLTTLAAFGDALIGPRLRNAGAKETESGGVRALVWRAAGHVSVDEGDEEISLPKMKRV